MMANCSLQHETWFVLPVLHTALLFLMPLLPVQANWADGPGRNDIERLYMRSGSLNGEAVVVFVRALCAVSQEELAPSNPEEPARYYHHFCP